jgi:hypothetical protein
MWILSQSQESKRKLMWAVQKDMQQQNSVDKDIGVETPIWYKSLRDDITSVDTLQERNTTKGISDLIKHRISLRKWIANWTVTSWNEAADYLEMRRWWLVDIFADYMMQNKELIKDDASAQLLQDTIKREPEAVIWYMKNVLKNQYPDTYEEKNRAIDDYIMKGGKLNDVMDFITEKNATPYWTPKEKKLEWTNPILNFLWSVVSTPIREIWWLTQIVWNKLWLTSSAEETARKTTTVQWASTQWYNEYKKSWKLPSKFSEDYANLYKWYDDAVKDWFIGSVEEYNNYLWDVAVATDKTFKQLTDDFTEKYLFNPEEAWAEPWNVVWDITEIVLTELATAWTATPELVATKLPKYAKYAKWLYQWLKWWAEFQALEDTYEWELSDVPEYAKSALTNMLLKWWLEGLWKLAKRWVWKLAKTYWWITERWEIALAWETPTSSAEKVKIIKESKWTNPERTPEKEIIKRFLDFRKKVKDDVTLLKWKQRDIERAYKWEESPADLANRLNENFAKSKNPDIMWEQTAKVSPEIKIWETRKEQLQRELSEGNKYKLEKETNKAEWERLSKLSPEQRSKELEIKEIEKWEKAKNAAEEERRRKYEFRVDSEELLKSWYWKDNVALIDVLKEEWNKMFVKEGREFNASNLWELTKLVESKSAWTEWTRQIVGAIKDTMEQISEWLWWDYGKIAKESWSKSDILQWLDDVLWKLTRRTSEAWWEIAASEAWGKVLKWNLRELLSQAKKFYPEIDLNKEIDSWLIHLAIYDPEKAAELAKNIYPSLPWVLELLINGGKMIATKKAAKNIIEKNAPEVPEKISVWDAIWRSVRWKTAEWLVDFGQRF